MGIDSQHCSHNFSGRIALNTAAHLPSITRLLLPVACAAVLCVVGVDTAESQPLTATDTKEYAFDSTVASAVSDYERGLEFEYGRGVTRDDSKALYWYRKSASSGFAPAQYRLAVLHDNGWGTPVDSKRAFMFYLAAAEQGLALAQHDLAIAFFEGVGTDKNLLQAYKWLKIADLSGSTLMQKHLHLVSQEMTADEIATAGHLAAYWIERHAAGQ
jgi:hypothetical protein